MHDRRGRVGRAGLEGWVEMGIEWTRGALDHLRVIWGATIGHHGMRPVGRVHHMGTRGIHGGIARLGLLSGARSTEWADALHGRKVGDAAEVDALASEQVIEAIEGETWVVTLKERLALCDLEFKALSITSWRQRTAMPVLLVAGSAGCSASSAFWVFGIALKGSNELMEIAVGVARRDLPLFSCSCTSHTPRVTAAVGGAQTAQALHRRFLLLSASVAFRSRLLLLLALPVVVAAAVAAVAAGGAGWDPSAGLIEGTTVVPAVAASNQSYRRRLHRPTRCFVCIYMSRFSK